MKFLGILFVFFGYMLVYASTAAGGKFATEPWAGLFADAYTGAPITPGINPQAAGVGSFSPSVQNALKGNPNPPQAGRAGVPGFTG